MSVERDVDSSYITFPNQCLGCSDPAEVYATIEAPAGRFLVRSVWRQEVPVCRKCYKARRTAGFLSFVGIVALVAATWLPLFAGPALAKLGMTFWGSSWPCVAVLGALGSAVFANIFLRTRIRERWLDRIHLGVAGVRFHEDRRLRLRFRDESIAERTLELTAATRAREIEKAGPALGRKARKKRAKDDEPAE